MKNKEEKENVSLEELIEKDIKKTQKNIKILKILAIIMLCMIVFVLPTVFYVINSSRKLVEAKPIIYIYPESEQTVKVSLSYPEKITTSYPKYQDAWEVIANPNGDLIDKNTEKKLYSLYWEGKNANISDMTKGFVIKGEDVAGFLEEKLEILGLNEREKEEFIIYWLPKMEHNKYNYIYFHTIDEINDYMELKIEPEPETLIRVFMEFKALKHPIRIEEQRLTKVERRGYTVVEWGGTEIK